jgi:hypothetical protein
MANAEFFEIRIPNFEIEDSAFAYPLGISHSAFRWYSRTLLQFIPHSEFRIPHLISGYQDDLPEDRPLLDQPVGLGALREGKRPVHHGAQPPLGYVPDHLQQIGLKMTASGLPYTTD